MCHPGLYPIQITLFVKLSTSNHLNLILMIILLNALAPESHSHDHPFKRPDCAAENCSSERHTQNPCLRKQCIIRLAQDKICGC